eukprot:6131891-Prymnesium_polylepis.1
MQNERGGLARRAKGITHVGARAACPVRLDALSLPRRPPALPKRLPLLLCLLARGGDRLPPSPRRARDRRKP